MLTVCASFPSCGLFFPVHLFRFYCCLVSITIYLVVCCYDVLFCIISISRYFFSIRFVSLCFCRCFIALFLREGTDKAEEPWVHAAEAWWFLRSFVLREDLSLDYDVGGLGVSATFFIVLASFVVAIAQVRSVRWVDLSVVPSVGRSVGRLVRWSVGPLVGRLVGRSLGPLIGPVVGRRERCPPSKGRGTSVP